MNQKLIFTCTWGHDEPERATLPFVLMVLADRGSVGRALFEQIDEVPVQHSPAGTVEPRRPHAIAGMAGS